MYKYRAGTFRAILEKRQMIPKFRIIVKYFATFKVLLCK
jgi:hypothetical protein